MSKFIFNPGSALLSGVGLHTVPVGGLVLVWFGDGFGSEQRINKPLSDKRGQLRLVFAPIRAFMSLTLIFCTFSESTQIYFEPMVPYVSIQIERKSLYMDRKQVKKIYPSASYL